MSPENSEKKVKGKAAASRGYGFGTFKGVFTPSILTILGVIMYLRFGWVLGNLGLTATLVIVVMATSITLLTALSFSALATNTRVGGGGAYWMISRTLGPEAGAAVGIPLYFAKALGIAFYIAGFSEAFVGVVPIVHPQLVGVVTLLALTALAYKSADLALKSQFFILGAIVVSLVSFFMGRPLEAPEAAEGTRAVFQAASFWVVFAIFFPAVTGVEAGLDMSGDLKNPGKSLPWGTLAAIVVSLGVYLAIPIFLAHTVSDRHLLVTDSLVMVKVAKVGFLVVLGIWGATLSSAMGSILGAPRVLQAMARDRILPPIVGKGYGARQDPRIATMISFGIALVAILLGDLNAIAPILSMFFLISYGLLNLCAAFEGMVASPSWRPKFKVHWGFSLLGAVGCFAAMFMIDAGSTLVALGITGIVFYLMQRRALHSQWGDMRYGLHMLFARYAVYSMMQRCVDERNWKPNLLVLSGSPTSRWHLIQLANAITHDNGFLTVAAVVPANAVTTRERIESLQDNIKAYLHKRDVEAIVKVHRDTDFYTGAWTLIRTYGFGPIVPNTILLGASGREENMSDFAALLMQVHRVRKNLVLVREGNNADEHVRCACVDIWWGGKTPNAALMLAFAYCIHRSEGWGKTRLNLKLIAHEDRAERERENLQRFLNAARIEAGYEILINNGRPPLDIIREGSAKANMVFLGMRPPRDDESPESYGKYFLDLQRRLDFAAPTVFVLSAEHMDFKKIFESAE